MTFFDIFDSEDWFQIKCWAIGIAAAVLLGFVGYAVYLDEVAWEAFMKKNHCHVIATQAQQMLPMFGSDGTVHYIIQPERNTYLCDNNYEVTR